MTTVTHHDPGAAAPAPASAESAIVDARGRRITLKRPPVLRQFDLILAVGPDTARNDTFMQLVLPLLWVSAIDDEPIKPPRSKAELDALIQRLDDEGLSAVTAWIMTQASRPAEDDLAKNSSGTPNFDRPAG